MRKQLLKLTLMVAVLFSAAATYAQPILYTAPGKYKLGARTTDLFMTINIGTGALEWQQELPGDDPTQTFTVQDHVMPASAGYVQITTDLTSINPALGTWRLGTTPALVNEKDITVTALPGDVITDISDPAYEYDQFQRRKAKVDANGDADSEGANPADGNNALFIKVPGEGGSRFGVIPTAAGELVQFDGGGIDVLDYHLVELLSNETFDTSSVFISNPVNDQLTVKGLTADVNKVSVYNLLGSAVLTKSISGEATINLNVSSLATGMYIVKLEGANGTFSKKIIKQ
ncbi:T9SS type A sorting domain-containing protein [Cognatitamlana onchidii]|uniref:T9SS type A sorting domain-containing protein n=1 Tax=Cognatitamlana onchidii TaxID=2562860 RepID=UPI0010A5D514|nr:T9SS type A sorting domain-containing protein [Algibacter onchidii]